MDVSTRTYYGSAVVEACEANIASLLKLLEQTTGDLVESIDVVDMEVTTLEDSRPRMQKKVVITMMRRAGHEWSTTP
jgi:hypothetical protein